MTAIGQAPGRRPFRMNSHRTRAPRWALRLLDGLVSWSLLIAWASSLLLLSATVVGSLTLVTRLARGNPIGIYIITGFNVIFGCAIMIPAITFLYRLVVVIAILYGERCPKCCERKVVWRGGDWKRGDPPDYRYFECASCGARFRQLFSGTGPISGLEEESSQSEAAPGHHSLRPGS
jgi:hypothetical protein